MGCPNLRPSKSWKLRPKTGQDSLQISKIKTELSANFTTAKTQRKERCKKPLFYGNAHFKLLMKQRQN